MFVEPALFLVRPDRTLYYASVQSMPFGRPCFEKLLGIEKAVARLSARGECGLGQQLEDTRAAHAALLLLWAAQPAFHWVRPLAGGAADARPGLLQHRVTDIPLPANLEVRDDRWDPGAETGCTTTLVPSSWR